TLTDVLLTVSYTAHEAPEYRDVVLRRLGSEHADAVTGERWFEVSARSQVFFSTRVSFPDQWYHLHHPVFLAGGAGYGFAAGQTPPPHSVRLALRRADFPANEDGHAIARVTLALAGALPGPVPVNVTFEPADAAGGPARYDIARDVVPDAAAPGQGRLTLFGDGAAAPAVAPFGTWTVHLRNEADPTVYPALFAGAA